MVGTVLAVAVSLVLTAGGETDSARARASFESGQQLFKKARYREAVERFEEAYRTKPHPSVFYNIAKCHEQLGDHPKALRYYREYLRQLPEAKDRQRVSELVATFERRLRAKGVQQLLVYGEPSGARVEVDGKDLGPAPAAVELPPGEHLVVVRRDGFDTVERTLLMPKDRSADLSITLKPLAEPVALPPPPPPPKTVEASPVAPTVVASTSEQTSAGSAFAPAPQSATAASATAGVETKVEPAKRGRLWTYIAAAGAGVGLAGGIGLGVAASGASNELLGSRHQQPEAQRLADQATTFGTAANIAYGAAAVLGVAAVVLFVIEPRATTHATSSTGAVEVLTF